MREEDTLVGFFLGRQEKGCGRIRSFAPGDEIIAAGKKVDRIHMVLSGTVLSTYTHAGKEIVRHHSASTIGGEEVAAVLGVGSFLSRKPSARRYSAASDCMVVTIDTIKLNDLYNDGNALPLIRDIIRNADPEVRKAVMKHLRVAYAKKPIPGMDPEDMDGLFRVPQGVRGEQAEAYDRAYRHFSAKIVYGILKKRMSAGEKDEVTLVGSPIHHEPPPVPGNSPERRAWELRHTRP